MFIIQPDIDLGRSPVNKFWRIAKKTIIISFMLSLAFFALTEVAMALTGEPERQVPHTSLAWLTGVAARWTYLEFREVFR